MHVHVRVGVIVFLSSVVVAMSTFYVTCDTALVLPYALNVLCSCSLTTFIN